MAVTESTCVYIVRDGKWLMLYRNAKKNDVNHGKWIGIGGKREGNETFEECAIREVKEETGFSVSSLQYEGEVCFYQNEICTEYIRVYMVRECEGTEIQCDEGTLSWIEEKKVLSLPLWEGDRIFLKRMMQNEHLPFSLSLYYDTCNTLVNVKEG